MATAESPGIAAMTSPSSSRSQPAPRRPPAGAVFPFAGEPAAGDGPATVINPEGRGAAATSDSAAASDSSLHGPGSTIWNRLFPSEIEGEHGSRGSAGLTLEHFTIEERIGLGGMGAVFRAVDQRLQRVVALKILGPAASRDPASVARFQNEARAAARLDHDGIARVFYIGQDRGLHFIAFEYVTGINIRDLIRNRGQIDPGEALHYVVQIAVALQHTTSAGIVHRDIKPSNVIITPGGRAKLVDLGLARKAEKDSLGELTIAGTTLGTFDYIAPEQARDPRTADIRSDIYSLGCTLYHMLTGEPPYPEGTVMQKLLDHQGKEAPDPALKNPRVPRALSLVVQKMMASDPRRRYTTPDDLIHDLLVVSSRSGLPLPSVDFAGQPALQPPRPTFRERHLGWMITAAVLAGIVILLDQFPAAGPDAVARYAADPPAVPAVAQGQPSDSRTASPSLAADGRLSGTGGPGRESESQPGGTGILLPVAIREPTEIDRGPSHPPRETDVPLPGESPAMSDNLLATREPFGAEASGSPPTLFNDDALKPLSSDLPPAGAATAGPPIDSAAGTTAATTDEPEDQPAPANPSRTTAPQPPEPPAVATNSTSGDSGTSAAGESPADEPTVEPPAAAAPAVSENPAGPIALSTGDDSEPRIFRTLEAACEEARDGSVIELNFSGSRVGESERPLRINGKKITIRAGRDAAGNRYRPLVRFEVSRLPAASSSRMITVIDGAVNLVNLDLEIVLGNTADPSQQWSLLSLQGPQHVGLQGVNISIVNPQSRAMASVIELTSAPGRPLNAMGMMKQGPDVPGEKFEVELTDSFVRGNADFAVLRHNHRGILRVEQSALALQGTLLRSVGHVRPADSGAEVELQLGHVTCAVGDGLIRVDSGEVPLELIPLRVTARNNIVASYESAPLIAMTGSTDPQDFRQLLRWSGQNNFYDGFPLFWTISSSRGASIVDPLSFLDWKQVWEAQTATAEIAASAQPLAWQVDWRTINSDSVAPAALQLDAASAGNPALAGATDDTDAGADLSRLPEFLLPDAEAASSPSD